MEISLTFWLLTIGLIIALFVIDLGAALFKPREIRFREALFSSVGYLAVALLFGLALAFLGSWSFAGQFFTGYLLERSLSIDNLFVFVIIISVFAVPRQYQQRVLIIGIFLALIFRVIFILLGAALLESFAIMFLLFGLLLIYTAIQLFRHRDEDPEINDNILVRTMRRRLPFSDDYGTGKFTVRQAETGRRMFTPLVLVLVAIASTDLLFALDSIPAIFGVTQNVYIVFTANAFALLGLRALFFLVTGLLDRLVYLSTGLSLILGLIGVKLALHWGHLQFPSLPEISTGQSLIAIIIILALTTMASIWKVRHDPQARAHAGSLRSTAEKEPGND